MTTSSQSTSITHTLAREDLLLILQAAYSAKANRFIRQTALIWLTHFPGDLGVTLWLAKSLAADGKTAQVEPILSRVLRLDPEFIEAQEMLGGVEAQQKEWQRLVRRARRLAREERLDDAELIVAQAVQNDPESIWSAMLQMQIASARREFQHVIELAEVYRTRWPDCLQFALLHASALLESGDEAAAVGLLHHCVVNDAAAQTPERLWGENFDYLPLWPDPLAAAMELQVPADVAAKLGWNLLPASIDLPDEVATVLPEEEPLERELIYRVAEMPPEDVMAEVPEEDVSPYLEQLLAQEEAVTSEQELAVEEPATKPAYLNRPAEIPAEATDAPEPKAPPVAAVTAEPGSLDGVEAAFERIARRLKQPDLSRGDGRYPVYVIFSTQAGIKAQYGESTLAVLDKEMNKLAEQVRKRAGWDAQVFYADGMECCAKYGLTPADAADPWKLKLALRDLDAALAKKGEMIGAVLIVGGPQVVPYHQLPNPTDDMDAQIPSDNPYAVLDGNYFIPDWPVGRLPGENGTDAGLLLEGLRRATRHHASLAPRQQQSKKFWGRVRVFLDARKARKQKGTLGYSAAVWRRSSLAVYRPIGAAGSLLVSPPQLTGSLPPVKQAISLAYYNLHGLVDAPEWYGQRDASDKEPGPDYPVALSPKDLGARTPIPEVVFSEACYGAHIEGKAIDQAIALKFLARGCKAVIGSTSAAYGSVTTPLIGADLLGQIFWKELKAGKTVGEALLQARVNLVREMSRRQGFLDGEDQKTLISFVLYGDPLASVDPLIPQQKSLLRARAHPVVKTISDCIPEAPLEQPVPETVLRQVKQIVAVYLPGLENGEVTLRQQSVGANGKVSENAKSTDGRVVVTVQKDVQIGYKVHHQVARVTLARGKMVKLALTK